MPWQDDLYNASFRGVPFVVKAAPTTIGRRTVTHEFPNRPEVTVEDMGVLPDRFTVEAFVIGPQYLQARDNLIAELKIKGPGALIHPYYGRRLVVLTAPVKINESVAEGGMATFSLEFTEVGESPAIATDSSVLAQMAADDADLAAEMEFVARYKAALVKSNSFTLQDIMNLVQQFVDQIVNMVEGFLSFIDDIVNFVQSMVDLVNRLADLIALPGALLQELQGALGQIMGLAGTLTAAFDSYGGLFDYSTDQPPNSSATPAASDAICDYIQQAALINASRLVTSDGFTAEIKGSKDLIKIRNELSNRLGDQAAAAETPQLYQAMIGLRAALVDDLTQRAILKPDYRELALGDSTTALGLAYRLYDDLAREQEIISLNRTIMNPLMVPAAIPLEVLGR
ncbi:MAG: DNA circularization N-terminal domain-containing protein [Candidatus Pacebacteria bacterium]|nr:DNA circularization N-terminal domain-containing protein [Candidatus Paceibacterota bacterium]